MTLELFISNNGNEIRICKNDLNIKEVASFVDQAKSELKSKATDRLMLSGVGLRATATAPHYSINALPDAKKPVQEFLLANRSVRLNRESGYRDLPVYDLNGLGPSHHIRGPSLLESDYTTVFVPDGWALNVNQYGYLVLEEVL